MNTNRNPYLTNAGLEDVMSILQDVEDNLGYITDRVSQANSICKQIRSTPDSYNADARNRKFTPVHRVWGAS